MLPKASQIFPAGILKVPQLLPLPLEKPITWGEIQLSARISSSNVLCWHYKGTTVYIGKVQCLLRQEGLHDPWEQKEITFCVCVCVCFLGVWYQKNISASFFHFLPINFLHNSEKHDVLTISKMRLLSFIWATRVCRCAFLKFHWQGCFANHSFWQCFSRLTSVTFFGGLPDYRRMSQKRCFCSREVRFSVGCRTIIGYFFKFPTQLSIKKRGRIPTMVGIPMPKNNKNEGFQGDFSGMDYLNQDLSWDAVHTAVREEQSQASDVVFFQNFNPP